MHNTIKTRTLVKQSPSIPQFYGFHCVVLRVPGIDVISQGFTRIPFIPCAFRVK